MGILYVVATPIGNLDDVTFRSLEILKEVDMILCEDTRQSIKLLNHYNIKNKLVSYHKFNEKERSKTIINALKNNKNIALISDAGTPCISDPGYILVKEAKEENIEVIGVGGISAVVTAMSVSGLNSDKFAFYGFFPRENKDKTKLIEELKNCPVNTLVFYESPKRIIKTLEYLLKELGNINISVSSDLTKLHEKNYFGKLDNVISILKSNPNTTLGEYTFIIEKQKIQRIKEDKTIESLLIDIMVKENKTIKETIDILNEKNKEISKKDIYNASLNLKKLIK